MHLPLRTFYFGEPGGVSQRVSCAGIRAASLLPMESVKSREEPSGLRHEARRGSPRRRTARVAFHLINVSGEPGGVSHRVFWARVRAASLVRLESDESCDVPSGLRHEARRDSPGGRTARVAFRPINVPGESG